MIVLVGKFILDTQSHKQSVWFLNCKDSFERVLGSQRYGSFQFPLVLVQPTLARSLNICSFSVGRTLISSKPVNPGVDPNFKQLLSRINFPTFHGWSLPRKFTKLRKSSWNSSMIQRNGYAWSTSSWAITQPTIQHSWNSSSRWYQMLPRWSDLTWLQLRITNTNLLFFKRTSSLFFPLKWVATQLWLKNTWLSSAFSMWRSCLFVSTKMIQYK